MSISHIITRGFGTGFGDGFLKGTTGAIVSRGFSIGRVVLHPQAYGLQWIPRKKEEIPEAIEVIEEIAAIMQPEITAPDPITAIPADKVMQVERLAKKVDLSAEDVIIIINLL